MIGLVIAPDEIREALTPSGNDTRVGDSGVDLGQIADNAGIVHEPFDIRLVVGGHPLRQKLVESGAEVLTLPQDRYPGQPRLESLKGHPLVQARSAGHRLAPLSIVVVQVLQRRQGPRAAEPAVGPGYRSRHERPSAIAARPRRLRRKPARMSGKPSRTIASTGLPPRRENTSVAVTRVPPSCGSSRKAPSPVKEGPRW